MSGSAARSRQSRRPPAAANSCPRPFEIVSLAETPLPLDVSEKVSAELDTRLDARFLDVRRPRVAAVFEIRSAAMHAIHQYFHHEGFTAITTPKIVAAATEGGTELFPIAYFDKEAFLNQSPQLYKQMMMAAGCEKVYEIGPIFRAEEHNTTKHLNEATSIDIEVSFADHLEVMRILEDVIVKTYEYVDQTCPDQLANLEITDFAVPKGPVPPASLRRGDRDRAKKIEDPIKYGDDISTAAERAIGAEMGGHYFIVDWPSEIRPVLRDAVRERSLDLQGLRPDAPEDGTLERCPARAPAMTSSCSRSQRRDSTPRASTSTSARSGTACRPTRAGDSAPSGSS